jgi:zinc protease
MDKGTDAFDLMNNMLGGTFLSRLNMNLREDKHWSYGVFSGTNPTKGPGMFMARAPVQTDKTKESLQELLKELTQVNSTKLIAADEFTKEQTSAIFSVPGGWQSNYGITGFLVQSLILNRGTDYPGKYSSILKNLTLTDIQSAAAKVVKPQNLTWLVIGDRSKIEAGIRELNFGPVKILDADGNEVK